MTKRTVATTLAGLLVAGAIWAQEPEAAEEQERPEPPTHSITVLQHPYDLASFYRARPREQYGYFAGEMDGGPWAERYPIAGFYRAQGPFANPYGYSQFWTGGYGYGRVGATGPAFRYRRSIGQNGDLYLFAPTVLATVGPLTGVFEEGR